MYRPFSFVTAPFRTVLLWLVLVDLTFMLVNVALVFAVRADLIAEVPRLLKVTQDRSLPEGFNYLKWATISFSLIWLALRDKWLAPLLWAAVFAIIFLDDSFQLHEWLGHDVATKASLPSAPYLSGDDLGELIVFVLLGCFVSGSGMVLLFRSGAPGRALTLRYLFVIAALAVFGVGVDALHRSVVDLVTNTALETILPQIAGLIEDGGEMLVGSLAVALTLAADPIAPSLSGRAPT